MKQLVKAILQEDIKAIRENVLLKAKFQIEGQEVTPFEFAAFKGKLKIIQFLIEKNYVDLAFVSQDDDNYFSLAWALKYSAKGGHLEVVSYLLNYVREMYGNEKLILLLNNYLANTALRVAAANDHTQIVAYLCSEIDKLLSSKETTTIKGIALSEAIEKKALNVVNYFIALPNTSTEKEDPLKKRILSLLEWNGGDALITAIRNHSFKIAETIVTTLLTLSGSEQGKQILAKQLSIYQQRTFVEAVKAKNHAITEYIFTLAPTKECREELLGSIKRIDPEYAHELPQRILKVEQEVLVARKLRIWSLISKTPFNSEVFQTLPPPILDLILCYSTEQALAPGMALKIANSFCYEEIQKQKESQSTEPTVKQSPMSPWTARLQKKESFFKLYAEIARN